MLLDSTVRCRLASRSGKRLAFRSEQQIRFRPDGCRSDDVVREWMEECAGDVHLPIGEQRIADTDRRTVQ